MLVPIIGLLSIFVVFPFDAAVVSFYDWSFYQESTYVGLENYRQVLKDPDFFQSIRVGLKFALFVVPLQLVFASYLHMSLKIYAENQRAL